VEAQVLDLDADLAALYNLGSLLHLLLLHFLTLVHPFSSLVLPSRERVCEGNKRRVSGAKVQELGNISNSC
jgi:hypothetical protein